MISPSTEIEKNVMVCGQCEYKQKSEMTKLEKERVGADFIFEN